MIYANSFEEDRFLSTMQREDDAFKKLIDDRSVSSTILAQARFERYSLPKQTMVIPIYNNNPRAPMRDNVTRSKTTYSSRNAGGGEQAEEARVSLPCHPSGRITITDSSSASDHRRYPRDGRSAPLLDRRGGHQGHSCDIDCW